MKSKQELRSMKIKFKNPPCSDCLLLGICKAKIKKTFFIWNIIELKKECYILNNYIDENDYNGFYYNEILIFIYKFLIENNKD